jgi:hypothetical protein
VKPGAFSAALMSSAVLICAPFARAQQAAPQSAPPIVITDCRGGIASIELVELAAYDVSLRNTSAVAADEIRLTVRTRRNRMLNFDVKGTFSPAVDVTRRLERSIGLGFYSYSSSRNDCSVNWVHFVDGSSWTLK